jgi:hypothetical protein
MELVNRRSDASWLRSGYAASEFTSVVRAGIQLLIFSGEAAIRITGGTENPSPPSESRSPIAVDRTWVEGSVSS